ncbi:MAG: adenylate/guanylate cyclase domain-containing protein [Christensenellaceae bacterium]
MDKLNGVHFYINILNFYDVLGKEEAKTGNVTHAIHALDTYFSSIEAYGKSRYPDVFVVEKITGSRLHMYVTANADEAYQVVKDVSLFAYQLASFINNDIPKYKTLDNFSIHVGSAYGMFYEYEFSTDSGFSEITTIGYAANYAAKLQALSSASHLSISAEIFDSLPVDEKQNFKKVVDKSLKKYEQEYYYSVHLINIKSSGSILPADWTRVVGYANRINLNAMNYSSANKQINFDNLSVTQCKKIDGIPMFSDIRGFTSQFAEDDSNLEEMANRTQKVLESMYRVTTEHNGLHVQFQGDRELALFHNVQSDETNGKETCCFKYAVLAGMRMIDAVKPFSIHIGVGEDFGKLFATKIGARGEKDTILLGKVVQTADIMEDKEAAEDQLAITESVFSGLAKEDPTLAKQFSKTEHGVYIVTLSYAAYARKLAFENQQRNTSSKTYNGAWGE